MPALTRDEICRYIPHRDPFLWIDEVVDVSETRILARKVVPSDLDAFRGHYPGTPVLPGVLLCEAGMQAGAVLIARMPGGAVPEGHVPVAARLNNVKFRRIVRPGETLEIEVEFKEKLAKTYYLVAKVRVGGEPAVQFDFAVTTTPAPA